MNASEARYCTIIVLEFNEKYLSLPIGMDVSTDSNCKTSEHRLDVILIELTTGPDMTGNENNSVTLNAKEGLTVKY